MNEKDIRVPDVSGARSELIRYKREKRAFEERLLAEGLVWKRVFGGGESSSWIFNSIVNKHADVIDSIPTCVCLPREKRDEAYAEKLSRILPVILARCGFEQVYSDNAWEKLKHGTAVYGVFWNSSLEDGLGDIDIRALSPSDIFWEMGVRDIQDSKNLFIVKLCDREETEAAFAGFDYKEHRDSDLALRQDRKSVV